MTKETAKEYLPLVQALADGKTIQVIQQNECWIDLFSESEIEFSGHPSRYRIKPDPRRIWVRECDSGNPQLKVYSEKPTLDCICDDCKLTEFVEVVK